MLFPFFVFLIHFLRLSFAFIYSLFIHHSLPSPFLLYFLLLLPFSHLSISCLLLLLYHLFFTFIPSSFLSPPFLFLPSLSTSLHLINFLSSTSSIVPFPPFFLSSPSPHSSYPLLHSLLYSFILIRYLSIYYFIPSFFSSLFPSFALLSPLSYPHLFVLTLLFGVLCEGKEKGKEGVQRGRGSEGGEGNVLGMNVV